MKERILFLDRAKGIGIILVVYGHLLQYGSLPFNLIYSFHMPMFFIISGMLVNSQIDQVCIDRRKYLSWLKRVCVKYFFPYFFFIFLGTFSRYLLYGNVDLSLLIEEIYEKSGPWHIMMGPLWFLTDLAIVMMIIPFLVKFFAGGASENLGALDGLGRGGEGGASSESVNLAITVDIAGKFM